MSEPQPAASGPRTSSGRNQAASSKLPILIAEDDPTSRTLLTAVLRKSGHEVIEVCDGAEAWTVMQRPDAPRLALLDWMMPGIDGITVVRNVRAVQTDQPPYLIMLTTRSELNDIIEGLEAGADDYLIKPWDPGELRARVGVGCRTIILQERLADKMRQLQEALGRVRTLEGILPICSFCKKIRDDRNYWRQVEDYVGSHSEARFSHSICPECLGKYYPDFAESFEESHDQKAT